LKQPCLSDLHHLGSPKQPIQADVETICDLADAVKIESAQHSYGFNVKSAPAADSDAPVNGIRFHVANAAGFSEAVTKKAEVGRWHHAYMAGRSCKRKSRPEEVIEYHQGVPICR
jgi:hypothetical protein